MVAPTKFIGFLGTHFRLLFGESRFCPIAGDEPVFVCLLLKASLGASWAAFGTPGGDLGAIFQRFQIDFRPNLVVVEGPGPSREVQPMQEHLPQLPFGV